MSKQIEKQKYLWGVEIMDNYRKGHKYSHEEYMEISIEEMRKSKSEHTNRADPKVGALLVDIKGVLVETAHRGEIRSGDHAEYTIFSKRFSNR